MRNATNPAHSFTWRSRMTPNIASVLREAFAEYEPLYTREALAATTPTGEHVLGRTGRGSRVGGISRRRHGRYYGGSSSWRGIVHSKHGDCSGRKGVSESVSCS